MKMKKKGGRGVGWTRGEGGMEDEKVGEGGGCEWKENKGEGGGWEENDGWVR